MAGKECWSVGKGRGKVLPGLGDGGGSANEEEEESHPEVSPHPGAQSYLPGSVQMPCFAGCPYKTPFIQPTNIYGAPTRCQASPVGTGRGEVYAPPLSSRRKSLVWTQTQRLTGGTGAGLGEHVGRSK